MLGCTFKWVLRQPEILCFPSFLSNSISGSHGASSPDAMRIQPELQRSFTENMTNSLSSIRGVLIRRGKTGESTLYGNNCKGPLCDPYQKIPDLIFILGHKLKWDKQLEKDSVVAPLGIPISTMLIFLAEILTKYHIWKYFIILVQSY